MEQIFYRIVAHDPPVREDFHSQQALGRRPRHLTERALRLWDGLSVYETEEQASQLAKDSPQLGRYIAELRVPEGSSVRWELNTGRHGHCTLWAEPEILLGSIIRIISA